MLNYFLKLINCNKRRTTQGGGVAAPVGGQIFSEVLPYLEASQENKEEVEEKEQIQVPNIEGKTIKEAEKILKENKLEIEIQNAPENLDKENILVSEQTPKEGVMVNEESKIFVKIK